MFIAAFKSFFNSIFAKSTAFPSHLLCILYLLILLDWSQRTVNSFPQGAPAEVCESLSPKHGHKVSSQNLKFSPFRLIQYGQSYSPNLMLPVEIIPRDDQRFDEEPVLKGFIVQAFDPETFEYLGHFINGEGLNPMPECSAVTHENAMDKTSASLVWVAPKGRWGDVLFRATIVVNKSIYFENMLAEVGPPLNDSDPQTEHNNPLNDNRINRS